jgi:hypothetical protein
MFERVGAKKTEKGVAVFMRAYGIWTDHQVREAKKKNSSLLPKFCHEQFCRKQPGNQGRFGVWAAS